MHHTVTLTRPPGTFSHRMGEGWGEGPVERIQPTRQYVVLSIHRGESSTPQGPDAPISAHARRWTPPARRDYTPRP